MEKKTVEVAPGVEPIYANVFRVAQAPADFVLDFGHILPVDTKGTINARIIMSPISAKLLMHSLVENVKKYESINGLINIPKPNLADQLFKGIANTNKPSDETPPTEDDKPDG
ncbi:MAG TPA: DUF3467 domain-containing protein [Anaerolineales bacterium]|nr:DUF3467 domain-containing protein [Anaerolineales bacterium]